MTARHFSAGIWLVLAAACLSTADSEARERKLENRNGVQARELDPAEKGLVTGVGIEAHDIQIGRASCRERV